MARAGLEPATHKTSVKRRPNENIDGNATRRNRGHFGNAADLVQQSRRAVNWLLDATSMEDEYSLGVLGGTLLSLKDAEHDIKKLEEGSTYANDWHDSRGVNAAFIIMRHCNHSDNYHRLDCRV